MSLLRQKGCFRSRVSIFPRSPDPLRPAHPCSAMFSRLMKRLLAACPSGLALLAALGIIVGSIGFPMPPVGAGGAFPCQGHGCGCNSAEACWLGCCCLTPAQRLAWAEENGVTPPSEFLATLTAEDRADAENRAEAEEARPAVAVCCGGHTNDCCAAKTKNCCEEDHTAACNEDGVKSIPQADDADSEDEQPYVCAGRCHGTGHWWIAGGQPLALPMKAVGVRRSEWEARLPTFKVRYEADRDSPPTRPG